MSSTSCHPTLAAIQHYLPDQAACIAYLEALRWPDGVYCPYCQHKHTQPHRSGGRERHFCKDCHKSFSVTVGTPLEDSRLPLQKWFLAIGLLVNGREDISVKHLEGVLNLPYKTAWSLKKRILLSHHNPQSKFLDKIAQAPWLQKSATCHHY